jgi:hypothetical protein
MKVFMYANACCPERDIPRTRPLIALEDDGMGVDGSTIPA